MKNPINQRTRSSISPISYYSFIKQFLGSPSEIDVEALRMENEGLKAKVEELQLNLDSLSQQVAVV
jgi:hypothetical protein